MKQLLSKNTTLTTHCVSEKREEAPISGEYVLPEYCVDIAEILKCFAYPHIQNRQWSQDQLLVDGVTVIRVLYLAEDRRCLRSLEFAQPFSCIFRGIEEVDCSDIFLSVLTKYCTCRAVSPRKIEVRGAVLASACVDSVVSKHVCVCDEHDRSLFVRSEEVCLSVPGASCEKVFTISESLEFDHSLPPAEMLLGGTCQAVVRECKLLKGKVIVKGEVFLHQLYTDSTEGNQTYILNFNIPFSQIVDVAEVVDGIPYKASVQVLSDTEKCSVGPDGENTMLDVSVKLLIQFKTYQPCVRPLMCDAFHCAYPMDVLTDEIQVTEWIEQKDEQYDETFHCDAPIEQWQEILDVWAQMLDQSCTTENGHCCVKGRLQIGCLVRDVHGEIVCREFVQDYHRKVQCRGNSPEISCQITHVRYRTTNKCLDVIAEFHVCIADMNKKTVRFICDLNPQTEQAYPENKVSALVYYADAGETVWDIARKCHASPQIIMEENDLTEDLIPGETILVIPMCG